MKENVSLYLLTVALLASMVYLKSPAMAAFIVALWFSRVVENIFTRKNRDADITEIMSTLSAHKAQMSLLTKDITNVAERAKTILGDY